jgi:pimeloyl-ACP methyl ester carboxylesterase
MSAGADGDMFEVRSADGTSIAVWVDGTGPPLVLVHGALQDHTANLALVEALRDAVATFAVDRRGRGASGDASGEYAIEREFEDVAAVVDAVAERTGGPVALWGHSYGADLAMGGATLTANVSHLILYEPGLGVKYPLSTIEKVEGLVASGDLEGAAIALLVDIVEATEEEVKMLQSNPAWPSRVATAPTMPRELRAETEWVYKPGQFDGITAPALLLAGSESPAVQDEATRAAATAIPGARVHVLEGHGHMAHRTHPEMVAGIVREFIEA